MFEKSLTLAEVDSDIANAITAEEARQEAHIELIASENYRYSVVFCASIQLKQRRRVELLRPDLAYNYGFLYIAS